MEMDGNIVLKKIGLLIGVAACGALVTSCGDDETPDPTPTETATPTPTPTAAVDYDFAADFAAQSQNANFIAAFFTADGATAEFFNSGSRLNGLSGITYVASPNSVTFAFPDLADPVAFDADDFVSGSATERRYVMGDQALSLLLPFENVLRVQYGIDNQSFTQDSVSGSLRSERFAFFFNRVTTEADIDATLSYTGDVQVTGGDPGETRAGALSSPETTFTITPGSDDTVTGTINVFETVDMVQTQVASLDINVTLDANGTFVADVADAANGLEGQIVGSLAGANREELLIVFSLGGEDDDRRILGSFIGN